MDPSPVPNQDFTFQQAQRYARAQMDNAGLDFGGIEDIPLATAGWSTSLETGIGNALRNAGCSSIAGKITQ